MTLFEKGNLVKDEESGTVVLVTKSLEKGRTFFSGTSIYGDAFGEHYDDWLAECFGSFVGTITIMGELK